ncbi:hypothetical protein D9M69_413680 [compost metagenome]
MRVRPQLALVDQALLGVVDEFDRVFHRQDVTHVVFIAMVDHRRQRGGLARAGRPGHQHQPARLHAQVGKYSRGAQLFQREDLGGNGTEHRGSAALRVVGIDPEARQAGDLEREVDFQPFFVELALGVAHDVVHQGVDILVRHRGDIDPAHVAVDPDHRRHVR